MSISAQRQQVQETMFAYGGGERSGLARKLAEPARSPKPGQDEERQREKLRRKARQEAHRTAVQYAFAVATVAGLVGAVFLGGHVELARQAQRSVIVSEMLNQQVERSRILTNAQARDITPSTISQKAGLVGMVHPEESDTIIVP